MAESINPYKSRDKNVVIAVGVRYTKADADRKEIKVERDPYTKRAVVENKQASTPAS